MCSSCAKPTITDDTYWSQANSETSGDPNGAHQTTSADYDFNTSLPVAATDAGGSVTGFGYDAALNPSSVSLPTGASASAGRDYANLSSSSSVSYADGTDGFGFPITRTITTSQVYDGWGRVIRSVDKNNGQVNTSYDAMGRAASRTNPFTAGGTPGPATTFQYDLTNKAMITTLPGGNTVRSDYSGGTVTATDQVNRKIKRESDGLGRLIKVTEQDVAAGTLTQETSYSYSLQDKLTGVNQGGQLRSYKYDAMGRLLYEKIPEQSATINDGAGTMWSSKYTYTEWGGLANKQDARGVITSYAYDSLHRVTQVSYNTVSGVTTAPTVTYVYDYDVNWNTTAAGKLLRVNVGSDYQERYTFDGMLRVSSAIRTIGARTYTTSYNSYNEAGQLTQMTYPSSRQVSFTHDNAGRFNGLTGYVSSIGYNVAGQVTGDTLGNGVAETFGYDANRLQLTSQTATKSGNTLMNLTYGYQASAGQMGSGSTAGNAGQLMSISGTIGGLTESAGYSYDNLGRLLTSNQTSNGSSAQRRFAYDRWGNRTAMWDAVSGGNQIQSLALEQSGGVPTNRIQFNLPPGTNVALASNGATATASSSYSGGGSFPASSVINGDRKGVNWGSGGGWNDDTASTYPDWVQVSFNGSKTINEIDVFTLQDNYASPSEPTEAMTFSQYGIVDFKVQYWDGVGWTAVSGGVVTGNNKVWRKITFSSLTTDKIRVRATNALNSYSRVTEIEAYQVATPAYDAAGNVTNDGVHTHEYDSENRIVSVDGGSTATYAYDNQNRRYKKAIGSTVTHYVWDGSQVLGEHNGSTGTVLIDYIYSGSQMIAKVASGSTQYFLSDRLSVRLSLDTSGNITGRQSHLPFGEDFAETGTQQKQHFTSYERDGESGIDYGVNRHYARTIGRFMQVDPYSVKWSVIAPQGWNRYSYVLNDPENASDPLGLFPMINLPIFLPAYVVDINGGGGNVDGGAGGGGTRGRLEDAGELGGGGGGASSEVVTQQPSAEQQKMFRDFLNNLSQKCKDKLAKLDSKMIEKLSDAIGEVKVTNTDLISSRQAREFMAQQVIDIVLAALAAGDDTRKYGSMTVGQFFTLGFVPAAYGGTPAVLTVGLGLPPSQGAGSANIPGIYASGGLSSSYLTGDNFGRNMAHELMHYVTGKSDADLQKDLGTGGKSVSDWLKDGCPP